MIKNDFKTQPLGKVVWLIGLYKPILRGDGEAGHVGKRPPA